MNHLESNNETVSTFDSCIWEVDLSNHSVCFLSSTPEKIFGISQEQFVKEPYRWRQLVHPDDLQDVKKNQQELYSGIPIKHDYRIIRPDGEIRWLMNQTFPKTDHQGKITNLFGITFDITDTKNYEFQLKTTNKDLRDITSALHLTADVTITDTKGIITYANDKFCEISKYTREELIGSNHRLIKSGYHSKEVYKELWDTITQGQVWKKELKNKAKDGTYFWSDSTIIPFLNEDGVPYQYIAIRKDITAKKENEEIIRKLAYEDILTQLPNIRSLENHLKKLCQNKEEKFAVLLIGLDHFKSINDHYGFKTGNQVLMDVSKRLARFMKEHNGLTFHFSGDEFSILLIGIDSIEQVTRIAEKILEIVNRPIQIKDQLLYITATIGISCFPVDGNDEGTLLEKADIALNKGKSAGKNRYHLFTNLMDIESFKYFNLRNDLNKAIDEEEFFLQYQPKVELNTNQVVGAEALVRWEHPKWGTVPPFEFISIAEDTGLITKLGEWILNQVCMQIHEWNHKGLRKIPIAVNFSPLQFLDPSIDDMILNTLKKSNVDPRYLEIEITENFIFENYNEVVKKMDLLRNSGISFSIDDFGTGYSSLKTLKELHFDYLKIDRSFIKDLHNSEESLQITKAMIQLAHTLEMKVVAEGTDDSRQVAILKEQNCDYIQGYSFSEPVRTKEFEKFLQKGKYDPEMDHKKAKQANINRRKYFRILFKYPLLGSLTVQVYNNKPVQIGSSSILIEDLGAGGLCFQSNIKFPLNKGFILGIKTTVLDHDLSFTGRNVWCHEIDNHLYQYGFEFNMEESERAHILQLLNQLQVKYRKEMLLPNCSFIKLTNTAQFFENDQSSIIK